MHILASIRTLSTARDVSIRLVTVLVRVIISAALELVLLEVERLKLLDEWLG
jgi:hypothetical protein